MPPMPLRLTRFEPKHLKPALCRRNLIRPATSGEGKRAAREYQQQVSIVLIRSGDTAAQGVVRSPANSGQPATVRIIQIVPPHRFVFSSMPIKGVREDPACVLLVRSVRRIDRHVVCQALEERGDLLLPVG
jgi:hypothetical protein